MIGYSVVFRLSLRILPDLTIVNAPILGNSSDVIVTEK